MKQLKYEVPESIQHDKVPDNIEKKPVNEESQKIKV